MNDWLAENPSKHLLAMRKLVWALDARISMLGNLPKAEIEKQTVFALVSPEVYQKLGALVRDLGLYAGGVNGLIADWLQFLVDNCDDDCLPMPEHWLQRRPRLRLAVDGEELGEPPRVQYRQYRRQPTKRQQIMITALMDESQRQWSDSHLARRLKIPQQEISRMRRRLEAEGRIPETPIRKVLYRGRVIEKPAPGYGAEPGRSRRPGPPPGRA